LGSRSSCYRSSYWEDLIYGLKNKDLGEAIYIPSIMLKINTDLFLDDKNIKEVQVQFLDENPAWIPYDTLLSMLQVDIKEDYTEWKDL